MCGSGCYLLKVGSAEIYKFLFYVTRYAFDINYVFFVVVVTVVVVLVFGVV